MKKTCNYINPLSILTILFAILISGCETFELDESLQSDPSFLTPTEANLDLVLNEVQIRFVRALNFNEDNEDGINVRASETVRMTHLFGTYTGPFSLTQANINDIWTDFYTESLKNAELVINEGTTSGLQGHVGIAKLITAYSYVMLVDTFGDVPFTEALKADQGIFEPIADDGSFIYEQMFALINNAKTDIQASDAAGNMPSNDLFYGGDADKWIKLANTLQLKMLVQTRLVDNDVTSKINTLLNQPLIDSKEDDFEFQYTTNNSPFDSRHPYYTINYDSGGADDYMNSNYVNLMLNDKGFNDPRLRYYFYRQTDEEPTGDNLPCEDAVITNFCYVGNLYWTRDHGDNLGVPPDGLQRSTYGLYPIGGAFDGDTFTSVNNTPGAQGAGIFPIMLSSYVKFLRAEAALTETTADDAPRDLLEAAINDSMDKVLTFDESQVVANFAASDMDVENYVNEVLSRYDAAANDDARLDIIMLEYYIALWGNGIEAWNNFRRTSKPSVLMTTATSVLPSPGAFPRSFFYPTISTNLNSKIEPRMVTDKVFWDANTDELK